MDASIVTMSQDLSLEDGSVTNFIVFKLPSGQMIRAVISDESAQVLVENLAAQKAGVPPPPPRAPRRPDPSPPPAYQHQETNDEGAVVFGGGGEETGEEESEEPTTAMWSGPPAIPRDNRPPPPPPERDDAEQQAYEYRQRKMKNRPDPMGINNARTVAKDADGYPVVRSNGGVDPGELLGVTAGGAVDEDGVGSI